ncbi:MAG: hypothetical protein K2I62_08215 [Alistipes sp.]|nr:hypothetical protein [Alistipes sp.]MDE5690869.1 hypothetical protein [Alistipes sp.]MDE6507898.1 hypothetical protein [Alistipes sp.]MDE7078036.1 hypothetical protein [Alistipes sp.]
MKKTFATLALALCATTGLFAGNIKESSVPAVVKSYVMKTYPRVSPVEWNYEEKGNYYTAEFKIDGADYNLDISPEGTLINSTNEIAATQLPAAANAYIAKQFPGFQVKEARKLVRRGSTYYEADIHGQNSNQMLTFSESGKLLDKQL